MTALLWLRRDLRLHDRPALGAALGEGASVVPVFCLDPRRVFRRYVPELRDVPDEYLAEPWNMPEEAQREAGCVIGQDYPAPIVDHSVARREALARYAEAARA